MGQNQPLRSVGVIASEHIAVGLVEDHRIVGQIYTFPRNGDEFDRLERTPPEEFSRVIVDLIRQAAGTEPLFSVGVAVPGVVRDGSVIEAPNLSQIKGLALRAMLAQSLGTDRILILNDADALAAGLAAYHDELNKLIRVWMLGTGIGYGRYPQLQGIWEGGHCSVTLDPRETFCACGGVGHLEGIMGWRAIRLRFLDLEPEEVFEQAREGDERCRAFVKLWHRALAAATGSSIHLDGPGKFYITGPSARFIDSVMLNNYVQDTVKMSSLQGSFVEVVPTTDEMAIIGAAVDANEAFSDGSRQASL